VTGLGSAFETAFNLQAGILESRKEEIMLIRTAEIDDRRTDKLIDMGSAMFTEWMRRQPTKETQRPDGTDELVHLCREIADGFDADAWEKILAIPPTDDAPEAWADLRTVLDASRQDDATRPGLISALETVLPGIMTYDMAAVLTAHPPLVSMIPTLERIKEITFGG